MYADGIQRNCTMAYIIFILYNLEFLRQMTASVEGGTWKIRILLLCVWTVVVQAFFVRRKVKYSRGFAWQNRKACKPAHGKAAKIQHRENVRKRGFYGNNRIDQGSQRTGNGMEKAGTQCGVGANHGVSS